MSTKVTPQPFFLSNCGCILFSGKQNHFFTRWDKFAFITTAGHLLIKHELYKPACDHPNMVNNNKVLITKTITSQESSQLGLPRLLGSSDFFPLKPS